MPATRTTEAQRLYMRDWRRQQPVMAAANDAANKANRRARDEGAEGRVSASDVLALWSEQPACMSCGQGRGLDHVVPMTDGGRNDATNLQNLCWGCNSAKEYERRRALPAATECGRGHPLRFTDSGRSWCRQCKDLSLLRHEPTA